MRPLGVTLIAVWRFLWGGLGILLGLVLIVAGGVAAKFLAMVTSGTGFEHIVTGLGIVVGLIVICFSLVELAAGWGVWALKQWGRILCIALSAISLLFSFRVIFHPHPFGLVRVLINAGIIVYLLMGEVKAKFA
jgi:hypothetical protein